MRLTPDGARYLRMARGGREPMPFHLRWVAPAVLGDRASVWRAASIASVVACACGVALIAREQHGATMAQAALAAALFLGLPCVRLWVFAPVLVDALALAFVLGAVVFWPVSPWIAVPMLIVASCVSEKSPIWVAAFAWTPLPLLALAIPAVRFWLVRPAPVRADDRDVVALLHPLDAGLKAHAFKWRDPRLMLLPWGACLAALANVELWWAVPAALAYGQLLVATDSTRLYQASAPVVCIAAALVIPGDWAPVVLVAHWFNPWAGNGV